MRIRVILIGQPTDADPHSDELSGLRVRAGMDAEELLRRQLHSTDGLLPVRPLTR